MPHYRLAETFIADYATKTLISPDGEIEATFAPGVGMVGCSLKHQGDELLELGGGLAHYAQTGATMGIPLLHPWANRLNGLHYAVGGRTVSLDPESRLLHFDPNGLPIHGLLAASALWKVLNAGASDEGACLSACLDFAGHPELLAAFPFPHELVIDIRLQDTTLSIATTLRATGDVAVPISFGYHPYLRLPGVPRAEWLVDLPVRRQLILDDRMIPTGASEAVHIEPGALGDQVFDTGFSELDHPARFILEGGGRRIELVFVEGYSFAQVYAPAGKEFICFEPMTAPTNALVTGGPTLGVVAPSQHYTAVFALSVFRTD